MSTFLAAAGCLDLCLLGRSGRADSRIIAGLLGDPSCTASFTLSRCDVASAEGAAAALHNPLLGAWRSVIHAGTHPRTNTPPVSIPPVNCRVKYTWSSLVVEPNFLPPVGRPPTCAFLLEFWVPLTFAMSSGGVLHDGMIASQTASGVRSVFAPKVSGAANLAAAVAAAAVQGFAAFSSVAAFIGSAGQASYAAANAAMNDIVSGLHASGVTGAFAR